MANPILKYRQKSPLYVRVGTWLLLLVFVALLAGRFTLDRVTTALPGFDLRLGFLYLIITGILIWIAGAHQHLPKPLKVAGSGLFIGWVGWLLLSSLWAPKGARLESTLLDLVILLALILLAWAIMRRLPGEATAKIWKWMLIAGLIYFALAMAAGPGAQGRYAAPGGGPNVFVRIMVLASIAALYFTSVKKRTVYLLPVPLFAVGAALSGSRGGLLSAAIILVAFSVPVARQLGAKRVIGLLLVAGIGIGILATINNGAVLKFAQERYVQQTIVEGYSSGRDEITEDALRLFRESPIIGVGADGYWVLQAAPEQFEYPHNLFIATMAESGTVGLLLLIAALLAFLIAVRRSRPMPPAVLYAFGAGAYQCIASVFSGDYYDTRLMWFFLGLAVIEAARSQQPFSGAQESALGQSSQTEGTANLHPSALASGLRPTSGRIADRAQ